MSAAATTNNTTSATMVSPGAPALDRVTSVPGSSTGYWATPQPHTTAATPSAAMTRTPAVLPRVSSTRTASPHTPAATTSGSARPVRRSYSSGLAVCSSASVASESAPATSAAAWARRVK